MESFDPATDISRKHLGRFENCENMRIPLFPVLPGCEFHIIYFV